ncbi:MAG: DUF167 domain-containing protein [Candidatus Pacebacteria bacterium]|nr:DUF167 domain-containing protein [Candidatus Paceibacterota bacterium]
MYIKVNVFPRSKKEKIKEVGLNRFEVRVREKAERNLANKRVLEIMARYFEVDMKEISIINGHRHPIKLLKIRGNSN